MRPNAFFVPLTSFAHSSGNFDPRPTLMDWPFLPGGYLNSIIVTSQPTSGLAAMNSHAVALVRQGSSTPSGLGTRSAAIARAALPRKLDPEFSGGASPDGRSRLQTPHTSMLASPRNSCR